MVRFSTVLRNLSTTVADNLSDANTNAPSCHQSGTATLLDSAVITVNQWSDYPKPPQSFLERDWLDAHIAFLPQALSGLTGATPCTLSEESCASRIVGPLLSAFINCLIATYSIVTDLLRTIPV
ncbi:hypothetical protein H1R20_g1375, partial [Candolleomyces eurysporus]